MSWLRALPGAEALRFAILPVTCGVAAVGETP